MNLCNMITFGWISSLNNTDVIAFSSFCVAFLSLFITLWQTRVTRRHNRLSVKPQIVWHRVIKSTGPLEYLMESNGLGPAIIKKITTKLDDAVYIGSDIYSFINHKVSETGLRAHVVNLDIGSSIRAGEKIAIIKFDMESTQGRKREAGIAFLQRLEFHCTYESFYGDVFEANSN